MNKEMNNAFKCWQGQSKLESNIIMELEINHKMCFSKLALLFYQMICTSLFQPVLAEPFLSTAYTSHFPATPFELLTSCRIDLLLFDMLLPSSVEPTEEWCSSTFLVFLNLAPTTLLILGVSLIWHAQSSSRSALQMTWWVELCVWYRRHSKCAVLRELLEQQLLGRLGISWFI